jgi:serine/threonine protein phosphatase PrpC
MMKTPPEVRAARLSGESGAGSISVEIFALSDVGRTREHNEDAFVVSDLTRGLPLTFDHPVQQRVGARGLMFMVADGMGGAAAGELASATAVDVVLRYLREHWTSRDTVTPDQFVHSIEHATQTANGVIYRYAAEHAELRGMGTTSTIAGLLGDTLYLAQVGDSRAYLIRDGLARQITKDQSLIQKLVEAGELTVEEAELSERRNIILQALGPEAQIKIDLTHQRVRRGDVLILCSDGLSGIVRSDEIARAVREEPDLPSMCRHLVMLANEMGGPDNITVVAARFDGAGLQRASEEDEVGHRVYESPALTEGDQVELETLLRERTEQMMRGAPIEPFPAGGMTEQREQREQRQQQALMIRAALLAAAVLLGLLLVWRFWGRVAG